ncbi:MAG: iron-containing alcohol dehydrogenase [Verrucomicrobia bacterium]|nr:iron-containing alcohol dehydrogenase [Verrucomicrobiota bacterium]
MGARIALPRLLRVGGGSFRETGGVLRTLGLRRPFVVSDVRLEQAGLISRLEEVLRAEGIDAIRSSADAVPDPTTTSLGIVLAKLQGGEHDCVIGLGGGSSIDTAKAVAVLAIHPGPMRRFKSPHQLDAPGLPVIAIPTTAGTGSEATRFTIVTDVETGEKMLCIGLAYLPIAAIIDYELTLTKPKRLTADTGVDSLTHAIEAFVSRQANPFADGFARAAMAAIWRHLPTLYAEPGNRTAREAMMLAATQAGIAFSNSSVALVHGMSRPIGAQFHVAHGLSNAMLLPTVTAFSISGTVAVARYAECAVTMGLADPRDRPEQAAERLVESLRELNRRLEVPTPQQYGIAEGAWRQAIPLMARQAIASGSPANNPRVPSETEIQALYEESYSSA